jgi:hypothetical protein
MSLSTRLALTSSIVVVSMATSFVAIARSADGRARAATGSERQLLKQAAFDYYYTNPNLSRAQVTEIRVLPLPGPARVGGRVVTKYAFLVVNAWGTNGKPVGDDRALAVYSTSPEAGWRVYNDGTEDVGCSPKWYPVGQEQTVLAALGLSCQPSG